MPPLFCFFRGIRSPHAWERIPLLFWLEHGQRVKTEGEKGWQKRERRNSETMPSVVFRLEQLDDHMVALYHKDEELGVFSQMGATAESIQAECAKASG